MMFGWVPRSRAACQRCPQHSGIDECSLRASVLAHRLLLRHPFLHSLKNAHWRPDRNNDVATSKVNATFDCTFFLLTAFSVIGPAAFQVFIRTMMRSKLSTSMHCWAMVCARTARVTHHLLLESSMTTRTATARRTVPFDAVTSAMPTTSPSRIS